MVLSPVSASGPPKRGFTMRFLPLLLLLSLILTSLSFVPGPASTATAAIVTPGFTNYASPTNYATNAGEPSIGVNWATGNAFFQSYTSTYKINFSTTPPTWSGVTPLYTGVFNIDPILFTDSQAGRTFAGGLNGQCSILAYTDSDGASWTPMTNSCASPAYDHETIGMGPWHNPPPAGATYGRGVYYCAQEDVEQCAVSTNGGLSFGPGVPLSTGCSGLVGHVKVAPDGTVVVPAANCGS